VDEDEEDVDEEDEEVQGEGFIADTHPDDEAELPVGAQTDDRRHRELDRQREQVQQMDAEKQAEILKERYGRSRTTAADVAHVPKRMLLPGVDDPSIWGVKCKERKEKEAVFAVTRRIEELARSKTSCPIISAFERASMPGYLYVEARRQADVFAALDGISNVFPRTKIILVPIKEMPDLLRVIKSKALEVGSYVRIKRGKYAGDLAQVDDFEPNSLTASLRIVPRLDYGLNEDTKAPMVDGNIKGTDKKRARAAAFGLNKVATRPPQRLFSEIEAKRKEAKYLESIKAFDKKQWRYKNQHFVNGFLVQDFKLNHLQTENVDPKLEEVTMFTSGAADGTENLDLAALAASIKNTSTTESYLPGDMVEVYEGEQQGVLGKAIMIHEDIVTVRVTEGELRGQSIEVPVKGLRKRFREGDHVKVVGGSKYRDEIGMVVNIKADTVTILSDLSMQEITVFSKDLREASDAQIAGGLGKYDLHDLVQLE
jgi:transcription elongation factor SPT5